MDLTKALEQMRSRFKRHLLPIKFPTPHQWLKPSHPLYTIFWEKDRLVRHGQVYYGHIVQANSILFEPTPQIDCPASILYSTAPIISEHPQVLRKLSAMLYDYKDVPLEEVPEQWRELARIITDEHDCTHCTFSVPVCGQDATIHFIPMMIFRSHLPGGILNGSLLPIIVAPNHCSTVTILPQQFWPSNFKNAWLSHQI